MKIIITALLLGVGFGSCAQVLKDCEDCSSKFVLPEQLKGLSIDEIRYLTNDLFARKGYVFQDAEIDAYYSEKNWYKPLNANYVLEYSETEKRNIKLFQERTNELKAERSQLVSELKKFKEMCLKNDAQELKRLFHYNVVENTDFIKNIVDEILMEDIHWYKNEGLYSVVRDNGEMVKSYILRIAHHNITFEFSILGGSCIGEGKTLYPREQITELSYRYVFEFSKGRLVFIKVIEAG